MGEEVSGDVFAEGVLPAVGGEGGEGFRGVC